MDWAICHRASLGCPTKLFVGTRKGSQSKDLSDLLFNLLILHIYVSKINSIQISFLSCFSLALFARNKRRTYNVMSQELTNHQNLVLFKNIVRAGFLRVVKAALLELFPL